MKKIKLSVIVTCHVEGIVAHKTVLSVFDNLKLFDLNGICYEIIVNCDRADNATLDYFKRYSNDSRFTILQSSFGNPAEARNYAISKAQGEYVAFWDGDDLISKNWLFKGVELCEKHEGRIAVHPEVHLSFSFEDDQYVFWHMVDSSSKANDALIMVQFNRWVSPIIAKRDLLLRFPYFPAKDGYGYEDYYLNCELLAAGVEIKIVPETVIFYRRSKISIMSDHVDKKVMVAYNNLWATDYLKTIELKPLPSVRVPSFRRRLKTLFTKCYKFAFVQARKIALIERLIGPMVRKIIVKKRLRIVPEFVLKAWREINVIENQLYPTEGAITRIIFKPENDMLGRIYRVMLETLTKNPDYLFMTPELNSGGTEKLLVNYVNAIKTSYPEWQIAIMSKLPETHPYKIPDGVDFVDFNGITEHLSLYDKNIILERFIVQTKVKYLHIINNEYYYRWIADHLEFFSKNDYKIYVSLFMREFTENPDQIKTHADPYLTSIWPAVSQVFTDNRGVVNEALANNAFETEKFIVHYQPETANIVAPRAIDPKKPLRILWASRLAYQKRPDILKAVAAELNPRDFRIDVYGRLQHYRKSYLRGIPTLRYCGTFNGIDSLPTEDYDVYLYTSQVDGLPNILLEIAAKGLPIVASDVGGVGEFVKDGKTGLLIAQDSIEGYVNAIESLHSNPTKARELARAAQVLLKEQHSQEKFVASIKRDIN